MLVKKRIALIRLLQKLENNQTYAQQIGVSIVNKRIEKQG